LITFAKPKGFVENQDDFIQVSELEDIAKDGTYYEKVRMQAFIRRSLVNGLRARSG